MTDWSLAEGLLAGTPKSRRSFRNRFDDVVEQAYGFYRPVRKAGLDLDGYRRGVERMASRALLTSIPASDDAAQLDSHVKRIVGYRDAGLVMLMQDGVRSGRDAFEERYQSVITSLLARCGKSIEDPTRAVEAVLHELEAHDAVTEQRPIDDYCGRSAVPVWLFAWTWGRHHPCRTSTKRIAPGAPTAATTETVTHLVHAYRATLEDAADDDVADRDLLDAVAHGRHLIASFDAGHHQAKWRRLRSAVDGAIERLRRVVSTAESGPTTLDGAVETVLEHLAERIAPICGANRRDDTTEDIAKGERL